MTDIPMIAFFEDFAALFAVLAGSFGGLAGVAISSFLTVARRGWGDWGESSILCMEVMCLLRLPLVVKALEHIEQGNGRVSACIAW